MKEPIAVVGAGGCGREVAWTVREAIAAGGPFDFAGHVVTDGSHRAAQPVPMADVVDPEGAAERGIRAFVLGVGSPAIRAKLLEEIRARFPDARWPSILHPTVQYDRGSVRVGDGVVVCAATVMTVNVSLAPFVLVHYACTIGHETAVGANSVLNPGCNLSGGVRIGERVLVGAGAVVLQYRAIGDNAVVGAGAVVTRDVAAGETVVGSPARPHTKR